MSFEHSSATTTAKLQPYLFRNALTIHRWPMTRLDSFFDAGFA
jgi:hypothetical protein